MSNHQILSFESSIDSEQTSLAEHTRSTFMILDFVWGFLVGIIGKFPMYQTIFMNIEFNEWNLAYSVHMNVQPYMTDFKLIIT